MEVIVFSSRVRNYPAQNMLSAWWKNNAQNIAKPCFSFVGFVSCLKCKASSLAEPIKVNVCQTRAQDSVGGLVQVCTIKMTGLLHDLQGTNRWCSHQCQEIHLPVVERVAVGGRSTTVSEGGPRTACLGMRAAHVSRRWLINSGIVWRDDERPNLKIQNREHVSLVVYIYAFLKLECNT